MMVVCPTHKQTMKLVPAGISKRTNEPYDAFYACPVFTCKVTAPATDEPSYEEMQDRTKANDEEAKELYPDTLENGDGVEDKPMTRLDWNIKEYIKGLGVFSAAARAEGMDPATAFESMHIWEWMDVAYGDMPGYLAWKAKAKQRIK